MQSGPGSPGPVGKGIFDFERKPHFVVPPPPVRHTWGKLGAILVVVGLVMVGLASILVGEVEFAIVRCSTQQPPCSSQDLEGLVNQTGTWDVLQGIGFIVTGFGLAITLTTILGFVRRPVFVEPQVGPFQVVPSEPENPSAGPTSPPPRNP
jgi:hypothetical protein